MPAQLLKIGPLGGVGGMTGVAARDSSLRVFASGGASMQLGRLRKMFFDFSKLELVVDVGLTAPEVTHASQQPQQQRQWRGKQQQHREPVLRMLTPGLGLGPPAAATAAAAGGGGGESGTAFPGATIGSSSSAGLPIATATAQPAPAAGTASGHKHPAFAVEQKGAWHALTLSATQQIVGPVRLRGDWRFALDSHAACPKGLRGVVDPRAHLQLLRHVGGMRPSLVESAYGVDVVVPGSSGAARVVAWWSPGRKEGMLELRLL